MLRRLKFIYILYNLFQRKKLFHNVPVYKKLGIKKRYYSPVSSKDFRNANPLKLAGTEFPVPPTGTVLFESADKQSQESILSFNDNGYIILKNYLEADLADAVNREIEHLMQTGKLRFENGNKLMFAIHKSTLLKEIGNDEQLLELLSSLLGGPARLFQSINFLTGSEQHTHSDSIHMTTFPLGGLLGVWIALEDITMENGPLHYYPGSHKLPYYLNSDYDNDGNRFLLGDKDYSEYEAMLEKKIAERQVKKQIFTAGKGDLLIWHANLMHGGEPHINKNKTRKSMVLHYYNTNCICYHEITQRPALMG